MFCSSSLWSIIVSTLAQFLWLCSQEWKQDVTSYILKLDVGIHTNIMLFYKINTWLIQCWVMSPVSWLEHHVFPNQTQLWIISSNIHFSVLVGRSFVLLFSTDHWGYILMFLLGLVTSRLTFVSFLRSCSKVALFPLSLQSKAMKTAITNLSLARSQYQMGSVWICLQFYGCLEVFKMSFWSNVGCCTSSRLNARRGRGKYQNERCVICKFCCCIIVKIF